MMWIWLLCGFAAGAALTFIFSLIQRQKISAENIALRTEKDLLSTENKKLILKIDQTEYDLRRNEQLNSELKQKCISLDEKLENERNHQQQMQVQLQQQFENLARRIFDDNSEKLTKQNQFNLTQLIDPLKEKLKEFEEKVRVSHKENIEQNSSLKEQIFMLRDLGMRMSEEAKQLASALKGDNKQQGNWGEMILEKILETSGLRKDLEYKIQATGMALADEFGKKQIPDVLIMLPDGKHLIIDSKVSLVSYTEWMNSEDETQRNQSLRRHTDSLKKHIQSLNERHYQRNEKLNAPDLVFMFLPIEASFTMALQFDNQMLENAWNKKVVPVTPSTLFASLKTVASIWSNDKQNRYAQEIADLGGLIYDQVKDFTDEMEKVKRGLELADNAYNDAMKRLSTGNQSILKRAEKMRLLGAKNKKLLPASYVQNIEDVSDVELEG